MAISIKDVAITTENIADAFYKEQSASDKRKNAAAISSKLTYNFNKIGFNDDDIKMYMSVSDSGGKGRYMFNLNMDMGVIKEFFLISDKGNALTVKEKSRLEECLIEMLPIFNKIEDYEKLAQLNELKEDTEEYKTLDCKLFLEDCQYDINKERICTIVDDYYINCMLSSVDFYEKRMFVSVNHAQKQIGARRRIYYYQYILILEWSRKWDYIMASIEGIRNIEEIDNRYELCMGLGLSGNERKDILNLNKEIKEWGNEQAEKMYSESYWISIRDLYEYIYAKYVKEESQKIGDIETNEEDINKDECLNKCREAVVKIYNYNNHKDFKDDFKYLIGKALEELEVIRQKVLEKEKTEYYYLLDSTKTKEDFEKLYKIREAVRNKRKLIMDYK